MFAIFNLYIKGVCCHSSAEEIKLLKEGESCIYDTPSLYFATWHQMDAWWRFWG
mgnify:CR=1 FL=1